MSPVRSYYLVIPEPEQTTAVDKGLGQGKEVLCPVLRAGDDEHGADPMMAVCLFEKSLAKQMDIAAELAEQAAVASFDSCPDHFQVKDPALPCGRIRQGEDSVRDNVPASAAGPLAPERDLAPEAGLAFH